MESTVDTGQPGRTPTWCARAWALPGRCARSPLLICLLMAAPFLPGAWRLLHAGVPDVLFTGDGAVIEIRTLHAAHGKQLLGPYSRFLWSHPGPAFFYLALPVYNLFGHRGPGLSVFAFVNRDLERHVQQQPDHRFVAASGGVAVYLRDPSYARLHRMPGAVQVLSAIETWGDPHVAVDGVVPADGTVWDSPASLVLRSRDSMLDVAVPAGDPVGILLSVDGNDTYAVRCTLDDGFTPVIGTTGGTRNDGMRTRLIFSEQLRHCHTIQIFPDDGDGSYSVGEVAFLK